MGKISENIINSMFDYDGLGCSCIKEIVHISPEESPSCYLKACSDKSKHLHFSYAARQGLNLTGPGGGIIEDNVLGRLLAINDNNIDDYINFFDDFGFLVPLKQYKYLSISFEEIVDVVDRIKATIRLMNSISRKEYKGILINTTYLLYMPSVSIKRDDQIVYKTCEHEFTRLLFSHPPLLDINDDEEVFMKGTFSVVDSFLKETNHISAQFYNAVRSDTETKVNGTSEPMYKSLVAMYVGCQTENHYLRQIIDFYYHFQTEVSVIESIKFGKISFYNEFTEDGISNDMKNALLAVAQIVVSEEINYNIAGIHPRYKTGTMTASWKINTLIEALYFSIFYMKAGQIYKECGNPNCKHGHYFLIDATKTNKKYCCEQCANAAASQRHRLRVLKGN